MIGLCLCILRCNKLTLLHHFFYNEQNLQTKVKFHMSDHATNLFILQLAKMLNAIEKQNSSSLKIDISGYPQIDIQ